MKAITFFTVYTKIGKTALFACKRLLVASVSSWNAMASLLASSALNCSVVNPQLVTHTKWNWSGNEQSRK